MHSLSSVLRIKISQLCLELRPNLIDSLESNSIRHGLVDTSIVLQNESDTDKVKEILTSMLAKHTEYVIAESMEDSSEIAILRKGDIEEVGLYLCSLCAMVFRSNEEKIVHESSHLFGFGF